MKKENKKGGKSVLRIIYLICISHNNTKHTRERKGERGMGQGWGR